MVIASSSHLTLDLLDCCDHLEVKESISFAYSEGAVHCLACSFLFQEVIPTFDDKKTAATAAHESKYWGQWEQELGTNK